MSAAEVQTPEVAAIELANDGEWYAKMIKDVRKAANGNGRTMTEALGWHCSYDKEITAILSEHYETLFSEVFQESRASIEYIKLANERAGYCWFSADSMRFFGTRILNKVHRGPGGVYFVTSEKPPYGPRRYSVRRAFWDGSNPDTVGGFCDMSKGAAEIAAFELAMARS